MDSVRQRDATIFNVREEVNMHGCEAIELVSFRVFSGQESATDLTEYC